MLDRFPVAGDLGAAEVHHDVAKLVAIGAGDRPTGSAQEGLDPGQQPDHLERFGEVVVGSESEPDHQDGHRSLRSAGAGRTATVRARPRKRPCLRAMSTTGETSCRFRIRRHPHLSSMVLGS